MSAVKTGRYIGTDEARYMAEPKADKPVRVSRPIQSTNEKFGLF